MRTPHFRYRHNPMFKKRFTHYAYYSGPNGMREPTGLLDLSATTHDKRRKLLRALHVNGELLSALPIPVDNVKQLRGYLQENGK